MILLICLPGAVAKYCNEYVCGCAGVSVREDISRSIHTSDLLQNVLTMAVARSSSGGVTEYQREMGRGNFEGFLPH